MNKPEPIHLDKSSADDFRRVLSDLINSSKEQDFFRSFFNVFVFSKRAQESEAFMHLERTVTTFQEIDRKLAICYPTMKTELFLEVIRHRFPPMNHYVRFSLVTGFRIKPEHGFYYLREEILFSEKKQKFFLQSTEQKTETELIDFLTDLFDRLKD